jgi:hypothetical protein
MDDTEFSNGERLLLSIFASIAVLVIGGLIFAPEMFWDDFIKIYIWDPIVKDAGESGDAGYSASTLQFTSLLWSLQYRTAAVSEMETTRRR